MKTQLLNILNFILIKLGLKAEEDKLPRRFKKRWITALRSGKYKQGTQFLVREDRFDYKVQTSYCCLGVACILKNYQPVIDVTACIPYDYTRIPEILRGSTVGNSIVKKLVDMNDGNSVMGVNKKSFNEIADWIEENL